MKKLITLACLATTVSLVSGPAALAESIKGRVGLTGKIKQSSVLIVVLACMTY